MADWNVFCKIFLELFDRAAFITVDALKKLLYRVHDPQDNYIAYIEVVLAL